MNKYNGFRCYNGCPDDALQAKLDAHLPIEKRAKELCSTLFCTYFPLKGMYSMGSSEPVLGVHAYGTIDKFHATKLEAWSSILEIFMEKERRNLYD